MSAVGGAQGSLRVALGEIEHYTQARIGNLHAPETTGRFSPATLEDDSTTRQGRQDAHALQSGPLTPVTSLPPLPS